MIGELVSLVDGGGERTRGGKLFVLVVELALKVFISPFSDELCQAW